MATMIDIKEIYDNIEAIVGEKVSMQVNHLFLAIIVKEIDYKQIKTVKEYLNNRKLIIDSNGNEIRLQFWW